MFYIAVARFISKSALLSSTKDFTTYVLVKTSQSSKKWEGTGLNRQDSSYDELGIFIPPAADPYFQLFTTMFKGSQDLFVVGSKWITAPCALQSLS